MRIQPRDLPTYFQHSFNNFSPVYFIFGDEPLQRMEALDQFRATAKNEGYTEYEVVELFSPKDESRLFTLVNTPSLFSEKKVIECRLREGKLTKNTQETLQKVAKELHRQCSDSPYHTLLLIFLPDKLENADLKSSWFLTLERMMITIAAVNIPKHQFKDWLATRARALALPLTEEALTLLGEYTEGNLLAASQAFEKIKLIYNPPPLSLTPDHLKAFMGLDARYSVFDWVDALLQGDNKRTFRILNSLRNEGIEASLLCWAITREVRRLIPILDARIKGHPINDALMSSNGIFKQNRNSVTAFIERHSSFSIYDILSLSQHIDTIIKTEGPVKAWNLLIDLCLLCCSGEKNAG